MIVDSSALVAVALRERGHSDLRRKIVGESGRLGVGSPTLVELGIVLSSRMQRPGREIAQALVAELGIAVIPFTDQHWPVALDAQRRYGRGRHRAALNFGDCMTYAVAKLAAQPLLFVGNDFSQTDLTVA